MSKKITIKEQDVEEPAEETREEIVNQLNAQAPPPPEPPPPPASATSAEPAQQKADCKMRMRELYKCDACGKYLTKKSLNYSHFKTCKGKKVEKSPRSYNVEATKPRPMPNDVTPPLPPTEEVHKVNEPQTLRPPSVPLHEQMRMERRLARLNKINRLSMHIA